VPRSKTNPCHDALGNHTPALLRQFPRRGHPRHCATLCGMAGDNPVTLYCLHSYGRHAAPSRKDSGALEGKTKDYAVPAQGQRHDVGPAGRSPPLPSALRDHPRRPQHYPGHCIIIPDTAGACGDRTPPRRLLCLVRPHVNDTLESSHERPPNMRPLRHHPRSRSWTCTGRAMTPRQMRDSPGRSSTPRRCTPCLYT
jgi:hypothetical protein